MENFQSIIKLLARSTDRKSSSFDWHLEIILKVCFRKGAFPFACCTVSQAVIINYNFTDFLWFKNAAGFFDLVRCLKYSPSINVLSQVQTPYFTWAESNANEKWEKSFVLFISIWFGSCEVRRLNLALNIKAPGDFHFARSWNVMASALMCCIWLFYAMTDRKILLPPYIHM